MIISKIIEEKRKHIEEARKILPERFLVEKVQMSYRQSNFKKYISRPHHLNFIAEMKRSSPSKGIIKSIFEPVNIALLFQANGAAAISVVTDERFFDGKLEYLKDVKDKVSLPVLRNDFIIDKYQIYESAFWGADALILMANMLTVEELTDFSGILQELNMDAVCEVYSHEDIQKAIDSGIEIISISNIDQLNFRVDMSRTERLVRVIPDDRIKISSGGINTYGDMMFLKSMGLNAVIISDCLMEAENMGAKVRELIKAW